MTTEYLSLALESGDRITVFRDGRCMYFPTAGTPETIDDVRIDDEDETLTRLRARSLRMWIVVRDRVVGGLLCGAPAAGRARYV